jgi:hypothetical protein
MWLLVYWVTTRSTQPMTEVLRALADSIGVQMRQWGECPGLELLAHPGLQVRDSRAGFQGRPARTHRFAGEAAEISYRASIVCSQVF